MPHTFDIQGLTATLAADGGWGEVTHLAEVDSTNAEVRRRAHLWSPVVADHQTQGRGRLGRQWQAVPGTSVALSVLIPAVDPPGWLPLATGLAVRSALADEGVSADLKWPNDVQLPGDAGRKVCGILCQAMPALPGVIVGVGINISQERDQLPVPTATSLRLIGAQVDPSHLVAGVLIHLRRWHSALTAGGEQAQAAREAYTQACVTLGRTVIVHRPDGTQESVIATGIDPQGHLRVEGAGGSATVAAGDVEHIRAPAPPVT